MKFSHTPSKAPRRGVVICGAYGLGNAGDDAVLTAIVGQLRRIDRDMPVTVLTRRPEADARRLGVSAVHPFRVLRWLPLLRRTRLFVSGGGSLLQDVTSRRSLAFYLYAIRQAKKRGCAVQLYGCGIGPLTDSRSRRRTAQVLNECADVITLRDSGSAALLRAIGVTEPPVLLAADPALALPAASGERERTVGFVLRDWPGFARREAAFAAAARHAYHKYRLAPVFLCLAPEDRRPARAVCSRLEAEGVPCSVRADPRRMGRMGLVVSMRLHGLIFALRDGTPAAGVSYDPKVTAFCREAVLPVLALGEASAEALTALIDEAVLLDGEDLSAAAAFLRRRERVNGRAAAQLLAEDGPIAG